MEKENDIDLIGDKSEHDSTTAACVYAWLLRTLMNMCVRSVCDIYIS